MVFKSANDNEREERYIVTMIKKKRKNNNNDRNDNEREWGRLIKATFTGGWEIGHWPCVHKLKPFDHFFALTRTTSIHSFKYVKLY